MKPRSDERWPSDNSAIETIDTGNHEPTQYVGRFAPSPTGPLHLGSLVAAVASYLQARVHDGRWLLRIEDIDPPREQAGSADSIIRSLESFGFEWDGPTYFQSASHEYHSAAIRKLQDASLAYPCSCSRRDLADQPSSPLGIVYPGTCRSGCDAEEVAIRVLTDDTPISFDDLLQGRVTQRLEIESGDFIIKRRDGLTAYHLAVVVDDALQGITEIVRGIDLMDSTPRQILLQRLLGYATPIYQHIPVIVHSNGDKLSKLTGAPGIDTAQKQDLLVRALTLLGQDPPQTLADEPMATIWSWGIKNWQIGQLFGRQSIVNSP